MEKLLTALFVALLMAGCGGEAQKEAKDDPRVPLAIPCMACGEKVSKVTKECRQCGHPTPASVITYVEAHKQAWEEARIKAQGGPEVLGRIRETKENGATELDLYQSGITDLTPLAGLTKLERLYLGRNFGITDLRPLAGLTELQVLYLDQNRITDLTPLKGLTKLEELWLHSNPIPADQIEMLKKALPNCHFGFKPL